MDRGRFTRGRRAQRAQREGEYVFRLQTWALSLAPSAWMSDIQPYESCRVAGTVRKLRIDPANRAIDAVISDGTAEMTARWQLQRPAPELAMVPGRGVLLEGSTIVGPDGSIVLEEPRFDVFDLGRAGEPDE